MKKNLFKSLILISLTSFMILACEKPQVTEPDDENEDVTETPVEPEKPEPEKDPVAELDLDGYAVFFRTVHHGELLISMDGIAQTVV